MTTDYRNHLKRRMNQLKMEAYAICLAFKDPRVPWYAKLIIVSVVGYAFSPIDRFLNSIPILGYLDHLVLVPLGVVLAFKKMIPPTLLTDCRQIAMDRSKPHPMDRFSIVFVCFLLVLLVVLSATWAMTDWNLVIRQWSRWFTRMTLISESKAC